MLLMCFVVHRASLPFVLKHITSTFRNELVRSMSLDSPAEETPEAAF